MAKYKTEDGKIFDLESDAQAHANNLASKQANDKQQQMAASQRYYQSRTDRYNQCVEFYKAGNWDGVIEIASCFVSDTRDMSSKFEVNKMEAIARLNRDGDYRCAFNYVDWNFNSTSDVLIIVKQTWERKNGKKMTEADMLQIQTNSIENFINDCIVNNFDRKGANDLINIWENTTGRKMTKEDEIRITGTTFYEEVTGRKLSSGKGGFFGKFFNKK